MNHLYRYKESFPLERGGALESLEIAYSTFGTLNAERTNVIWVCHALTANSDVADWWPHTVEKDKFLDPDKWFVVCANIIGSAYGTTGPLSLNPTTGEPYYRDFPKVTVRDVVRAHILLADKLGIDKIHAVIGSSLGGFQTLEWGIMQPDRIERLILIATDYRVSPWAAGLNETQRMAVRADATHTERHENAGKAGMAVARALALLSYRGASGYNTAQKNREDTAPFTHRVQTYQKHQGEKLCNRFNAYSYMTILDIHDSHDISRGRECAEKVLASVKARTLCVSITTDILFTPQEVRRLSDSIPNSEYKEIESEFGHDGFLVEHEKLNRILKDFLQRKK